MKLSFQKVADIEIAAVTGKLNGLTRVVAKWKQSSDRRDPPPVIQGARMMVREMSGSLTNLGGTA